MRVAILLSVALSLVLVAGCSKKSEPLPPKPESSEFTGSFKRALGYDDEGRVTGFISGKSAKIRQNGTVEIYEMDLVFFQYEEGRTNEEMTATSPFCLFNSNTRVANSDAEITIRRGREFVVTGRGFSFKNEDRRLEIKSEARVEAVAARTALKALETGNE